MFETVMRWGWMDALLRHRAWDILQKSGLSRHLPAVGRLLDLGSGTGHLSEAVLKRHPGRVCIAADPAYVPPPPLAARLAWRDCAALRADGRHLPFADRSFDGAWVGFVLHHVPPEAQDQVLREVTRVLRPGATLVLLEDTPSTPGEWRTTVSADRRLNMEGRHAPHHYRSPAEWRAALPAFGYRLAEEIAFTRLFPPATFRPVQHRAFVCRLTEGGDRMDVPPEGIAE